MILPIKLRSLLRGRNTLGHNFHHAIPDLLLDRSILGTDPQFEAEHGKVLSLVHNPAAVDVVPQSFPSVDGILDALTDNSKDEVLPAQVQNFSLEELPAEPLPSRRIGRISPLRLDPLLKQAVLLHLLVVRSESLVRVSVVKDLGRPGKVIEVPPKVLHRAEGTKLLHVLFPCVGVSATPAGVLPEHPLCWDIIYIIVQPNNKGPKATPRQNLARYHRFVYFVKKKGTQMMKQNM